MPDAPSPDTSPDAAHPSFFAFRTVHGHQAGQVFALEGLKTMLQFDGSVDGSPSRPTRCLVIQGQDGVSIRTIQGELTVNNRVQKEARLKVNDEISCGAARLRLIRQVPPTYPRTDERAQTLGQVCQADASTEAPQPNSGNSAAEPASLPRPEFGQLIDEGPGQTAEIRPDTHQNAESGWVPGQGPVEQTDLGEGRRRFFNSLAENDASPIPQLESSTMCLNSEELRKLLEPTVYEADEFESPESAATGPISTSDTHSASEVLNDTAPVGCDPLESAPAPTLAEPLEPAKTDRWSAFVRSSKSDDSPANPVVHQSRAEIRRCDLNVVSQDPTDVCPPIGPNTLTAQITCSQVGQAGAEAGPQPLPPVQETMGVIVH